MKIAELRDLGTEELTQRLQELKRKLFDLRMQRAEGKLTQAHQLQQGRRDVARVLTLLRQGKKVPAVGDKS